MSVTRNKGKDNRTEPPKSAEPNVSAPIWPNADSDTQGAVSSVTRGGSMSVAEQLQQTPRGRLKYDRQRVSLQSIEDVLEEIHADMDSLQVRVAAPRSPAGYSSPPSFGLSSSDSEEELGTPLHPRATRMTCRGPWSPRAAVSAASPATRSPASRPSGSGRADPDTVSSAQSPACQQKTESSLNRSAEWSVEQQPARSVQRSIERSQERSQDRSQEQSQDRSQERGQERSQERSQEWSQEWSVAPEESKVSTPRHGSAPTPFTPRAFDKLLHDERQRHLEEAKAAARDRLSAAEETVRRLREQHEQRQRQLVAAQQERGIQQREQRTLQRQRSEQQLMQQQENIRQRQELDAKDLSERVQAAVQQQQADEEARRQKAAQQREKLDQMVAAQKQMRFIFAQVFNSIKSCADRVQLQKGPAAGQVEQLKQLLTRMDRLAAGPPAQLSIPEAEAAVSEATQLADRVTAAVDEINSSAAADQAAKEAKPATEAAIAAQPAAPTPAGPAVTAPAAAAAAAAVVLSGQSTAAAGAGQLGDAVLEEDRVRYEELQKKAALFRAQFSGLLADPAFKKFKFDCQKAINVPINAISPVSTAHLRDKLDKLRQLLRGQPVTVTGGQVSAAAHPHGIAFCLDLVAKKFVRQGEDVVSSKPEAAFALAAVLRALQLEFPELAELTLAHCQARCPYLVPLYPPQLDGDTNEQYYRKLGYDYIDGVVEKQDKFLKRMSGIARLYVALLIDRPPQSAPAPAPAGGSGGTLGVKQLWRWLAASVNLEPRADVTASLLLDVLEVGGATLSALYGAQFVKLVRLIGIHYLPRVQQVTPAGCGGPVVRLEQQLQRIITTGRVPPPHGELKLYNW